MRVKLGERRVKEGKRGRGREGTIEMGERGGGLFYKLISFPIVVWEVFREIPEEIYLVQM